MSSVVDTAEALATYSSSLNSTEGSRVDLSTNVTAIKHSTYKLKITPDDFFMFGSGFGDTDANQTPV
jgi:hypothetical protein